MAQVYNRLEVDVRTETIDIITAVQNDSNSRFLDVFLLDNGVPINLTGHEVRIYGKKADGIEIYNDGEITEEINGRCQFELTDQALAVAQDLEVQIAIYYNNVQILQSLPFTIHVVKSLLSNSAIPSSNEYGALVVLYQNLYEAYDLMTTMVQNIGVPKEIAQQLSIETMWEAWEYLCNYVSEDLTTLLQDAINNNSVDGVVQRIGETTDTGATETTGTVMGKENTILSTVKMINSKTTSPTFASKSFSVEVDKTNLPAISNGTIPSNCVVLGYTESFSGGSGYAASGYLKIRTHSYYLSNRSGSGTDYSTIGATVDLNSDYGFMHFLFLTSAYYMGLGEKVGNETGENAVKLEISSSGFNGVGTYRVTIYYAEL